MNRKEAIGALMMEAKIRESEGQPSLGLVIQAAGMCADPKVIEAREVLKAEQNRIGELTLTLIEALWDHLDTKKGF